MIEIRRLQKTVHQQTILNMEALDVRGGEICGLVCPDDSSKRILLDLLVGETRPSGGSIRIDGLDPVQDDRELKARIGVLFVENALYPRRSARGNLMFHAQLRGLRSTRVDEVLSLVGLADVAGKPAGQLHPDLARRLAFGRAILHHPSNLFLADPFAGCDSDTVSLLGRLVRSLAGQGAAVLILSSDPTGMTGVCHTLLVLDRGRLLPFNTPVKEAEGAIPFRVPVRQEDQVNLVNPTDILYIESDEGKVMLHTLDECLPVRFTLDELEQRLSRSGFFRAHRAYLVNLQRVKAIIPYTRDSFTLVLDDTRNTEIPLSKTSARELRDLLGY
jgi:ABC-2 type transport system ATP-binding protein